MWRWGGGIAERLKSGKLPGWSWETRQMRKHKTKAPVYMGSKPQHFTQTEPSGMAGKMLSELMGPQSLCQVWCRHSQGTVMGFPGVPGDCWRQPGLSLLVNSCSGSLTSARIGTVCRTLSALKTGVWGQGCRTWEGFTEFAKAWR